MVEPIPPSSDYPDGSQFVPTDRYDETQASVDGVPGLTVSDATPGQEPRKESVTIKQPVSVVADSVVSDAQGEPGQKWSLDTLSPTTWIAVFRQLSLAGVTGNIASHCEYIGHNDHELQLRLDSDWSTLYSDMHRERIESVLAEYFGQAVALSVTEGKIATDTPARWRERKIAQRLQEAKDSIYQDAVIAMLERDFAGKVLDDTIEPVGQLIH